jgi:hypothetical protein
MADFNDIIMVSIGFIVGSIICKSMQGHLAYATEKYDCKKFPADCDPVEPPKSKVPNGRKEKCGPLKLPNGKVITVCNITEPYNLATEEGGSDTVPNSLPLGGNIDKRSDPLHPNRAKDEKGFPVLPHTRTLEYPDYYPDDKMDSPLIGTENIPLSRSSGQPGMSYSEYARAYTTDTDNNLDDFLNKESPNLTPNPVPPELTDPSSDPLHPSRGRVCGRIGKKMVCHGIQGHKYQGGYTEYPIFHPEWGGLRVRSRNETDPLLSQPDPIFGEDNPNISTYARAYAVQQMQQQITLA